MSFKRRLPPRGSLVKLYNARQQAGTCCCRLPISSCAESSARLESFAASWTDAPLCCVCGGTAGARMSLGAGRRHGRWSHQEGGCLRASSCQQFRSILRPAGARCCADCSHTASRMWGCLACSCVCAAARSRPWSCENCCSASTMSWHSSSAAASSSARCRSVYNSSWRHNTKPFNAWREYTAFARPPCPGTPPALLPVPPPAAAPQAAPPEAQVSGILVMDNTQSLTPPAP